MTDPRINELMNQEIDGTNTPAETRELHAHLESHPESLRIYSELQEVVGIFEKVEMLDPPPGLRESILATAGQGMVEGRPNWRTDLRDMFAQVLRPALAVSFALGLIGGLLIFDGYRTWQERAGAPATAHLQGMAGHDQDTLSLAPSFERALRGEPVRGELRVSSGRTAALFEIEITTETAATVQLIHGAGWSGAGFHSLTGQAGGLRVTEDAVTFDTSGAGLWEIRLLRTENLNDPITLIIQHKGEIVAKETVIVQP